MFKEDSDVEEGKMHQRKKELGRMCQRQQKNEDVGEKMYCSVHKKKE